MSSLRTKILLLGLVPIVAMTVVIVGTTMITGRQTVVKHARTDLKTGNSLYVNAMRARTKSFRKALRATAKAATFDDARFFEDGTVDATLDVLRKKLDADFAWVVARNGVPASNAKLDEQDQAQLAELIELVEEDGVMRGMFSRGDRAYEMFTVPVTGTGTPLWLTVGIPIDERLVESLKRKIGLDVTAVRTDGNAPQVLATTLSGVPALQPNARIRLPEENGDRSEPLRIGSDEYVVRDRSFLLSSDRLRLLLQVPVQLTMAPYNFLMRVVVAIAAIALVLVLISATTISTVLYRSISRLVDATQAIRGGNYKQTIAIGAVTELYGLVDALREMQTGIASRAENMAYQARFDALTGLPNRFMVAEALALAVTHALEQKSCVSIMLVNLNRFSDIGASFGHDVGDALLTQAAERLRSTIDAQHTLARLEGDEFLVIMPGVDADGATEIAEELLRLLGAGLSVRDINIYVEASIGICECPIHGDDHDQLLLRAAVAENDARDRSSRIAIYEEGKEQHYARQLAILGDLRSAIRQNQLKLYLQPKIKLSDGSVCGAEALARWDHPTLGFLPPKDFIAIAEQSGNISLITRWALETAISECRLWHEEGLDLPISVNLSVRDLMDPDLPCFVHETLRDHDLDPSYLTVEITEQALLQDFEQASGVLQCLRDLGVRISIDDFGTGHSSLAKLKYLPVDELKIDHSFVTELPDNRKDIAIVRATIELAHNLGIEVLAEGIETRPAMRWLTEQGCERGQGFLISRPMPAETFSRWASHFTDVETQITRIFIRPHSA